MTRKEFQNLCDDICDDEADESWANSAKLRGIAQSISNVSLDFNADVALSPEFGEVISDA
jgi:hypothetical protein